MGLGPFNGAGYLIWDRTGSHLVTAFETVHWFLSKLVKYGTLITATVAIVGGGIALYSIYVTRVIARRRAAIDFFLKTEGDRSIVEIFQKFDESLEQVNGDIEDGKTLKQVTATEEYRVVHACLNIHELLAISVENAVFDEKVAYNYWSGVLVGHCKQAEKLINFSREEPDDYSAYIGMLRLNKKWKKKLDKWTSKQPQRPKTAVVVGGLTSPVLDPGAHPPSSTTS
jgi:hypothetical protein